MFRHLRTMVRPRSRAARKLFRHASYIPRPNTIRLATSYIVEPSFKTVANVLHLGWVSFQ